ncbi:histidine kinase, partial [Streptomyces sp. NPDC001586]
MTRYGQEPEKGPGGQPDKGPDEEGASLPVLLEAVLSVGSELELHATLQHIVDSAAELCSARYGARGGVGPRRARGARLLTAGGAQAGRGARPPRPGR